jgi:uncharacterized protein
MASAEAAGLIQVSVVLSPKAGELRECVLSLSAGSQLEDALNAAVGSGLLGQGVLIAPDTAVGIWGRCCARSTPLRDRDRVEVYRPLLLDPKAARRLRLGPVRQKGVGTQRSRRV